MKTIFILVAVLAVGCCGNSVEEPTASDPPAPESPFHLDHKLDGYEGCLIARSTDTSKVELRGPTCTDDGAECFDFPDQMPYVEVWATDEAEKGTPFGASSFVEITDCDAPCVSQECTEPSPGVYDCTCIKRAEGAP